MTASGKEEGNPANKHGDKLRNITDKIAKALDDIDALYEGHNHQEEIRMLKDLSRGVDSMDSGPLKAQLKVFLNSYQDVSTQLDDIINERDKVIDTMAKFMEHSHYDPQVNEENPPQDSTLNYKMLFGKIKRINDEINAMKTAGGDVTALKREKEIIQKEAIKEFENQQKAAMSQEAETIIKVDHSAWKFAAGEIVGLLHKTRDGGAIYIAELEVRITDFIKEVENCNLQNQKYRAQIAELRSMERKWKEHYMRLTKERVKAEKSLKKCQAELTETRQILRGYIHDLPASQFDKNESQDNQQQAQSTEKEISDDVEKDVEEELKELTNKLEKTTSQLNETRKHYSDMRKKVSVAEKKLSAAERKLKQRNERIEELEVDKMELMQQMNKSLLRPDTRRLSVAMPLAQEYPTLEAVNESISSITDLPDENILLPCKKCKCKCQLEKSDQILQDTVGSGQKEKISKIKEEIKKAKTQSQCGECRNVVRKLETQLQELNNELSDVKNKLQTSQAKQDGIKDLIPASSTMGRAEEKQDHSKKKSLPVPVVPKAVEEEFIHLATPKKEKSDIKVRSPEPNISSNKETEQVTTSTAVVGMKNKLKLGLFEVGVQTDPHLDPLSHWSPVVTNQEGWRPPIPPANWVDFDPTPARTSPGVQQVSEKRETMGDSMIKGDDPSNIRRKSMFMADFMKRETERMIQGIQGFLDFTNTMVGEDIIEMEKTNNKLISHLPRNEQRNIESILTRPPSSDLAGNPWRMPDANLDKEQQPGVNDCFNEIKNMGTVAMQSLRQAYNNFYNSLHNQHREYEQIYSKMQELPKEQMKEILEKEQSRPKSKITIHMPEIPHLKSENTRKQEGGYSKSKPVTPGLPAIDKTEKSGPSIRLSDPNMQKQKAKGKKKGVVQLTVFSKEERRQQEKKANASHVPLSLLSGSKRVLAARSKWGDKKTSTKEKVEDQGQTGILDVLGSFIQDYTPDDINRTLDSYTEKTMLREKKKMIEAKTEMWAHHRGAENWHLNTAENWHLNTVGKTNGAFSTGTRNMVSTTPVLPPLHGSSLSPAIVQ